jgi:hypothetical protein
MRVELHGASLPQAAAPQRKPAAKRLPFADSPRRAGIAAEPRRRQHRRKGGAMRKFVIEREIPGIGAADAGKMREVARKSNAIIEEFGGGIEWLESYVSGDKIYCVYLARDEAIIRKHAEKGGFPANRISEVKRMIDPTSALA